MAHFNFQLLPRFPQREGLQDPRTTPVQLSLYGLSFIVSHAIKISAFASLNLLINVSSSIVSSRKAADNAQCSHASLQTVTSGSVSISDHVASVSVWQSTPCGALSVAFV